MSHQGPAKTACSLKNWTVLAQLAIFIGEKNPQKLDCNLVVLNWEMGRVYLFKVNVTGKVMPQMRGTIGM
jgi:hypothetical protein